MFVAQYVLALGHPVGRKYQNNLSDEKCIVGIVLQDEQFAVGCH
jgi:hypothetical protein